MTTSEWTTSTAWVRGSGPVKAGVVRQLILTVHESGAVRRGGWQEFTSRFRNEACRLSHRLAARCSGDPQCFPRRGASRVQDCFRCAVLSSHHLGNEERGQRRRLEGSRRWSFLHREDGGGASSIWSESVREGDRQRAVRRQSLAPNGSLLIWAPSGGHRMQRSSVAISGDGLRGLRAACCSGRWIPRLDPFRSCRRRRPRRPRPGGPGP